MELLKSSVQTFLNAMTMADRTVFPVSSRNDRDFLNLIKVYLDAVFHPMIYHGPERFLQEGWRYVLQDGALSCQGVVLNEMKGSFASPQTLLEAEKRRLLFPDNCYRFVSGGDPEQIPELSYERFQEAHKRFYHPSNAWIALVGSIDLDAVLQKIDPVLSGFDRRLPEPPVPL
ncbi:MAG: insulinase family protein [Oscillospiraceae bacterium]|nr:insulinase family protein [Oscillospiraceae bacterium]